MGGSESAVLRGASGLPTVSDKLLEAIRRCGIKAYTSHADRGPYQQDAVDLAEHEAAWLVGSGSSSPSDGRTPWLRMERTVAVMSGLDRPTMAIRTPARCATISFITW
jgi:hypothetical protein